MVFDTPVCSTGWFCFVFGALLCAPALLFSSPLFFGFWLVGCNIIVICCNWTDAVQVGNPDDDHPEREDVGWVSRFLRVHTI